MWAFCSIGFGAFLGANVRYWVGKWALERRGILFPYGTLIINVSGSFILGVFMTWSMQRMNLDPRWRLLVVTGFCGGYTTFSTYSLESMQLLLEGRVGACLANIALSTFLGLTAVGLGMSLGRLL